MNKRVAVYDRHCLFTEQNTLQAMRDYAKAQEWEVIEYVESKGKGQPALNNLLRDAKVGKFDVVLCHSLMSIGRDSLKNILSVMDKLRKMNISFLALHEGIDFNSSAGSLVEALQKGLATERSQKIRLGVELARMRNVLIGRRPLATEKVQSILEAHKRDLSVRDVAKLLKMPKSTCWRVIKDFEKGQAVTS